jgi:hypothetical protein
MANTTAGATNPSKAQRLPNRKPAHHHRHRPSEAPLTSRSKVNGVVIVPFHLQLDSMLKNIA